MLLSRALLKAQQRARSLGRRTTRTACVAAFTTQAQATSPLSLIFESLSLPSPTRVQYASAQGLRFAYFLGQAVLNSTQVLKVNIDVAAVATAVARALVSSSGVTTPVGLSSVTTRDLLGRELTSEEAEKVTQFWDENIAAVLGLFRQELALIEAGEFKMPYDLEPLRALRSGGAGASQWDPRNVVSMAQAYMSDQALVAERRKAGAAGGREVYDSLSAAEREKYPEWYTQNFHFQTGGWLSAESARLYDYQVETLFLGSADAMRRQVLPYIGAWLRARGAVDGDGVRLLDAGCGTGRVLSFVKDNWPALSVTAADLSPYYLAEARKTLSPWLGDGSRLSFLEGNVAAPLPGQADGSQDAVLCVYLFHELPADAREAAAAEFARLLAPGGRLFFVDSAQQGDGAINGMPSANDRALAGFPKFSHEPYYEEYTRCDLRALFEAQGLVMRESSVGWLTKVMVFDKPAAV